MRPHLQLTLPLRLFLKGSRTWLENGQYRTLSAKRHANAARLRYAAFQRLEIRSISTKRDPTSTGKPHVSKYERQLNVYAYVWQNLWWEEHPSDQLMTLSRQEYTTRLRQVVAAGRPIIGAGAGTGISAKCAEAGGADLIIIYNSGRYRMAGRGSLAGLLAYGDANAIVVEMAREVLPVVRQTPVLAGVNATDPFRPMGRFLSELRDLGFAGVQNFPTVGLIDGVFRANLEETGMGYELEVRMIHQASVMGLVTCPYVFDAEQARQMTQAGADLIVAHTGLTAKGMVGAKTAQTLDQAVTLIQSIRDAAASVNPEILVLCHGGPLAEPEDVACALSRTRGVAGFFGASSVERLPAERAITRQVQKFKSIPLKR